jgi:glycerophosphoryl diester phosphodiesterase
VLIVAHRGASADFPENTLSAFEGAVAQKADGVELDVMRCGSGELVVCHDETLERLAQLPWVVATTPYQKLSTARIFGKEGIPLLEEVLDVLPKHFFINVEIKCHQVNDGGLSAAVGRCLLRRGLLENTVVSSFNPLNLLRLMVSAKALKRAYLLDPTRNHFLHAQLVSRMVANHAIHPHESVCTSERVADWHRRGLQVTSWTVDDVDRAWALKAMGVDVLITNRPGQMRHALESRSQAPG